MGSRVDTAAVIVTHNRRELLRRAIEAAIYQSQPLAEIIVVDNASTDGTREMMTREFPSVTYLTLPENLGAGAAFGQGMRMAVEHGHQWIWMLNDDSFPRPTALEQLLEDLPDEERIGIVCCRNVGNSAVDTGVLWGRGRPIDSATSRYEPARDAPFEVDVVTFAGALVSASAVWVVGVPRTDYFMMWEDYEYCLRIRRAGYRVLLIPNALIDHLYAGSGLGSEWSPPWRGYYQTRNHLHYVLHEEFSLQAFWFWAIRTVKFLVAAVLWGDRKSERVRLRLRGCVDGLRGRMGKTIDPSAWAPRSS